MHIVAVVALVAVVTALLEARRRWIADEAAATAHQPPLGPMTPTFADRLVPSPTTVATIAAPRAWEAERVARAA